MRKILIVVLILLVSGIGIAASLPQRILVEFSDDSADLLRNQNIRPQSFSQGELSAMILIPVFYEPAKQDFKENWYKNSLNRWFRVESEFYKASEIAELLSFNSDIVSFELIDPAEAVVTPDDYQIHDMWGLDAMSCPEAWDIYHGDSEIIISTIDTGCRIDHPDLAAGIYVNPGEDLNNNGVWDPDDNNGIDDDNNGFIDDLVGYDFVTHVVNVQYQAVNEDYGTIDNEVFPDVHGHGTHVAGTAAGVSNNGMGVASASWNVKSMPLKGGFAWIDDFDNLRSSGYWDDFAVAVQYATDNSARVISISFGGTTGSVALNNALQYARDNNVIVFCAAGNDNVDGFFYPARYENVIAVAATNDEDGKAIFSNFGDWVDISAPGVDIWSTMSNNNYHEQDYASWQGTSMATPNAAAVAALILSYNPELTDDELETLIYNTADNIDHVNPGYIGDLGAGRINAHAALLEIEPWEAVPPTELIANLDVATGTVDLSWSHNEFEDFISFLVYRNGELLSNPMAQFYSDQLPGEGLYSYVVTAWYTGGESDPTAPVEVDWDEPVIFEHFEPVLPTGSPYAFLFDEALLDGESLVIGDEIGIFDGDLCVGATVISGDWPLHAIAWGADVAELPGFIIGNEITYKYWPMEYEREIEADPTYLNGHGDGTFGYGAYSEVELYATSLFYFEPVRPSGAPYAIVVNQAMFEGQSLVDGDEIGVFDSELCVGAMAVDDTWPLALIAWQEDAGNGIPGFTPGNTINFKIRRQNDDDYAILQPHVAEASYIMGDGSFGNGAYSEVDLSAHGLQFYERLPFNGDPYIIQVDNAICDNEALEFGDEIAVFDGDLCVGASVVTGVWPLNIITVSAELDQWLGFIPGNEITFRIWSEEAVYDYYADTEFIQGDGSFGSEPSPVVSLTAYSLRYFDPVSPTGAPFAILVNEALFDDESLEIGDEIGIYDGDLCVGALAVNGEWPLPVIVWQSDPANDIPGFTPGNRITYKFWMQNHMNQEAIYANPFYLMGNGTFGDGAYNEVTLEAGSMQFYETVQNTGIFYVIRVNEAGFDNETLEFGDEIAVFDGDLCVGASIVNDVWPLFIFAYQGDPGATPGFTPGNEMSFRIWPVDALNDYSAVPEYIAGDGTFGYEAYSELSLQAYSLRYYRPVSPTGAPYAIVIEEAEFDDLPLTEGDEIGIYDGELCVGAGSVTGEWPLAVTAWRGDPQNGIVGFAEGNPIIYNIWKMETEEIWPARAQYIDGIGNGIFGFGPYSRVILNAYSSHEFTLPLEGRYFELISTYVTPEDLNAEVIFGDIVDLSIVYQNNGSIFLPPILNSIGEIDVTEGYRIFCDNQSSVTISGQLLDPAIEYSLAPNTWNWLGYPFDYAIPVVEALGAVSDQLQIVMADDGRFWIPEVIDVMGEMLPGEGYYVMTFADLTFSYQDNLNGIAGNANVSSNDRRFDEYVEATGLPYLILTTLDDDLKALDPQFVEACDGDLLVGKSAVEDWEDFIPVIAWGGSEEYNLLGFNEGNDITLKVIGRNSDVISIINGESQKFGVGAFSNITLSRSDIPESFMVENAYPNPFNSTVIVPFAIPVSGEVRFSLWNVLGQNIFDNVIDYKAGSHRYHLNTEQIRGIGSGVYFLNVHYGSNLQTQKIMLLK